MDTRGNQSDWEIIRRYFNGHTKIRLVVKMKQNPSVKDRIAAVNARLCSADGTRNLFIHPRCVELKKDFEKVLWKQDMAGNILAEIDKSSDPLRTHVSDALAYLVWASSR